MSGLLADLRFALRQLIRRPGFALAAILTLALGIGANTAVFSLLNGYLLKPLPYPHDNRLVQINHVEAKTGNTGSMSVPSYLGIKRDTSAAFSALAAWKRKNLNLRALGKTQRVRGVKATASLFNVLKIRPFLGHAFTKVDQQPGRGHVAVLSYSLWKHAFGGDSNAIGQTLRLGGEAYKIVGVMPKRFAFPAGSAELWIPYIFSQREKSDPGLKPLEIIGRLAPGVTIALADQRLQTTLEHATRSSIPKSAIDFHAGAVHTAPRAIFHPSTR